MSSCEVVHAVVDWRALCQSGAYEVQQNNIVAGSADCDCVCVCIVVKNAALLAQHGIATAISSGDMY